MKKIPVCPSCSSAKVELGGLVGDDMKALCSNCGQLCRHKDLIWCASASGQGISMPFMGDADTALAIAQEVSLSYLRFLARDAGVYIGRAMLQSGIVGAKDPQLARLIKAACLGAHEATLSEVEKMQKEVQDAGRPDEN